MPHRAPERCPFCGADFDGGPIPEWDRPAYGGATRFSRAVGIVEHDRIDHWQCPDCGREFACGMTN